MPGVPDKNEKTIAGALCAPPENNENEQPVSQPRQPASLQGLLRFAMEATKAEDAPHDSQMTPMSEERRKFLESALSSLTLDVIQLLQKQIEILKDVGDVEADGDIAVYTSAFQTITEYVGDIDTANDFHKIGGFVIFKPCLTCSHPEIRAEACNLLAELCQNNPYCQKVVLDLDLMPLLLSILQDDKDLQVCVKALYAVSCIVRDCAEAFDRLKQYRGLHLLLKVLQRNDDKLKTKTSFLLSALCSTHPDLISHLVHLEYIPVLIGLISSTRSRSHEHILSLLVLLIEDNQTAAIECRNPKYNFKEMLEKYIESYSQKEECQEEIDYCKRLLNVVTNGGGGSL